MSRGKYSAEFKARAVLEVIRGEKELGEVAAEYGINPNMLRNWKREFVENAASVFDDKKRAKEERRKEENLKKERSQMLKTIGQLTLERDFLQDCFRRTGRAIPKIANQDGE